MNTFNDLWRKLAASKEYREEFVAAQVKRGIPFQIRALLKQHGLSQEQLAQQSKLTQGVISRAQNPNYGNLTLNTIVRIAAGFDIAFIGKFVTFSELGKWFVSVSEESAQVASFKSENTLMEAVLGSAPKQQPSGLNREVGELIPTQIKGGALAKSEEGLSSRRARHATA
ncbi:MAG: helix-turn-helix domain-containing protein [Acidobacteriia bacterium]|nr:helix-turn-helix domain-containing protein [Terriglobia bacterium]